MTLDQINYVLEINKTGSFSRAAENLFITQSALSLTVQNLERDLGREIFTRTSKGVSPTMFGKSFIRYISPISTQMAQIDALFFSGKMPQALSFILANDGFQVASTVFSDLFKKYEAGNVYMKQLENYANEAKTLVATGQADIGFIRMWTCYQKIEKQQMSAMGLSYQALAVFDLSVGVGPSNPLYNENIDIVTPDMLKDFPLAQHEYMDGGPYEDIISRVGIPAPKSRVVTSSRAALADILNKSEAYFISANTADIYVPEGQIRMIPLQSNGVQAELGWISRRGEALSPIAIEYTHMLEERFL